VYRNILIFTIIVFLDTLRFKILLKVSATIIELENTAFIYRVSRGECSRHRENVPEVKIHRYNQKHLYTKLKGYEDNGERKVWSSCGSTYYT